jgi:FtsZ-interacting cell division protein ZipA
MDTWVIVLIIIAAIVLVGIIVVGGRRARERQLDNKRSEAANLRTEADRSTTGGGARFVRRRAGPAGRAGAGQGRGDPPPRRRDRPGPGYVTALRP